MSGISTEISVIDRVTAPFQTMKRAIDICLISFDRLQVVTARAIDTQVIEAATLGMEEMNTEAAQITSELGEAASSQKELNDQIDKGNISVGGMLGKVKEMFDNVPWEEIGKVVGISDEMAQTTARIGLMAKEGENVVDIQEKIFRSAQASKSSYIDMAAAVAKMGNNAGDAFSSTDEIIAFSELVQKQFAIAGGSNTEALDAMLEFTQAIGLGIVSGEELNSIFGEAPNIIQTIADFMDVPIEEISKMASEGKITADIVKDAMFSATGEINDDFNSLPMTWAQIGTSIQNQALKSFTPVLSKINDIANAGKFQNLVNGINGGLQTTGKIAADTFDLLVNGASWVYDHWSLIAPIIGGVAAALGIYAAALAIHNAVQGISNAIKVIATVIAVAHGASVTAEMVATAGMTAAQLSFNAALYACPLVWILLIIIAVIAAIYLIVAAINHVTGSSISATGIIVGTLSMAFAYIYNNFAALLELVLGIVNYWYNIFAEFVNFFANCFSNPVSSIIYLFQGLTDTILGFIQKIAEAIDFVFGSNLASTVAGWRTSLKEAADSMVAKYAPNENYTKVIDTLNLSAKDLGFEHMDYKSAWNTGYAAGQGLEQRFKGMFNREEKDEETEDLWRNIGDYTAATADNTGKVAESIEITDEHLAYLRDIAEREIIDRTVFSAIHVEMGGITNTVNNISDLNVIGEYITDMLEEQRVIGMEGV